MDSHITESFSEHIIYDWSVAPKHILLLITKRRESLIKQFSMVGRKHWCSIRLESDVRIEFIWWAESTGVRRFNLQFPLLHQTIHFSTHSPEGCDLAFPDFCIEMRDCCRPLLKIVGICDECDSPYCIPCFSLSLLQCYQRLQISTFQVLGCSIHFL